MSKPPTDSDRLIDFLRQHRPVPPPTSPELEERIMSAIAASPQLKTFPKPRLWLISSAIAVSMLIAWTGKIIFFPPPPSAAELASIEAFMESTWEDVEASSETGDTELDELDPSPSSNQRSR